MKRADQIAGAVLLLLSFAVLYESTKLPMMYGSVPGSGFLPFWLSLVMVGLSALLLIGGIRRPVSDDRKVGWPTGRGLRWIGTAALGLLAYTYLVSIIGYILSTFAFLFLLVRMLGSYRWYWTTAVSLVAAVGLYVVFHVWLAMSLPAGLLIIP